MAAAKDQELEPDDVEVRLKPILGIKPGQYLTVLYGAALLVILFLLLFNPGIRNYGSIVHFESRPVGAAVYIDGMYAGATPVKPFVPSGTRDIRIEMLGFSSVEYTMDVAGRLFGSLLFPKRVMRKTNLELSTPEGLLSSTVEDLSEWALVSSFTSAYRPEPVVSGAARVYAESATESAHAERFLEATYLNASTPELASDILRATILVDAGRGLATPGVLLASVGRFVELAAKYPNALFFAPGLAGEESVRRTFDAPWFSEHVQAYGAAIAELDSGAPRFGRFVDLEGFRFVEVPAGRFVQGSSSTGTEHPHIRSTESFLMLQGEVTKSEYARFLEMNSYWRRDNVDQLISVGYVTEDYLADFDAEADPDGPLRFVSYHAAEAFTEWLTSMLPGYEARLPTESEWERAARIADEDPEGIFEVRHESPKAVSIFERSVNKPANLLGNLWEWCSTWYLPMGYAFTSFMGDALEETWPDSYEASERIVRGGSWADTPLERIDVATRGSYRPEWCTPFVGFRVVLVSE